MALCRSHVATRPPFIGSRHATLDHTPFTQRSDGPLAGRPVRDDTKREGAGYRPASRGWLALEESVWISTKNYAPLQSSRHRPVTQLHLPNQPSNVRVRFPVGIEPSRRPSPSIYIRSLPKTTLVGASVSEQSAGAVTSPRTDLLAIPQLRRLLRHG